MRDFLKPYRIKLTTVGPLYIGSGIAIGKKEYIFDSNLKKVYVPDMKKMYHWIVQNGYQKSFEKYMLEETAGFDKWLERNRIRPSDWKNWIAYTLDSSDAVSDTKSKIEIQTFIKDSCGCVYVPGSSLKGALRTILLGAELIKKRDEMGEVIRRVKTAEFRGRNSYLSAEEEMIKLKVFHKAQKTDKRKDIVNDCMSGLRISDSRPISTDCLTLCKKIDERPDGKKKEINVLRECIKPGTELIFDLTFDETQFDGKAENLLKAVEIFGRNYMDCFNRMFASGDKIEKNMIYLGGGSGYVSKTVTYPLLGANAVRDVSRIIDAPLPRKIKDQHKHADDIKIGISPHTIKKTVYNKKKYSFGLCKFSIEEL